MIRFGSAIARGLSWVHLAHLLPLLPRRMSPRMSGWRVGRYRTLIVDHSSKRLIVMEMSAL